MPEYTVTQNDVAEAEIAVLLTDLITFAHHFYLSCV